MQAQARLGQQEADAGRATQELTTAEGAVVPLHEKIRKEKTTVDKVRVGLLLLLDKVRKRVSKG